MKLRPSEIMMPQEGVPASTPTLRKLSPASNRITVATSIVIRMTTTLIRLGST